MYKHDETINQIKTMQKNFRLLRERKNWTLEELSQMSNIDVEILIGIENDSNFDFDIEYFFTLCHIYGVKSGEIFLPLK